MASASSSTKAPCATCDNKGVGIFRCEGCLQMFCRKHLNEHRDVLSHQLDEIVLDHDTLQQTIIDNQKDQRRLLPILKQIDQWEQTSIEKIQQLANDVREQVKSLTSSQTAYKELRNLAERLQEARLADDYMETDLQTWKSALQQLKEDLHKLDSSICIAEDLHQTLVGKLYIPTIELQSPRTDERFCQFYGSVHIGNNGLSARHSGSEPTDSYVCGANEYSAGTYTIRFVLIKNDSFYTDAFGITSKHIPLSKFTRESTIPGYGWHTDGRAYLPGSETHPEKSFRGMKGKTRFEIELQLNCDDQKICCINQQTKDRREMNVNVRRCPLPWQIQFYLYQPGDCVCLFP